VKRRRRAWKMALIEKLNPDWRDLRHELNICHSVRFLCSGRSAARNDA
jgi:hypothetical protein